MTQSLLCTHFHAITEIWDFHGGKTPQMVFLKNSCKMGIDRPSFFREGGEKGCEAIHTPVPEGCRHFSATPPIIYTATCNLQPPRRTTHGHHLPPP